MKPPYEITQTILNLYGQINEALGFCKSLLHHDQEELCELQNYLLEYPEACPVVSGTGGIRKVRWTREGRGKSGGIRVIPTIVEQC
ncbi:MAG: hypothetical protein SAMD01599839_09350 [Rectinema sp.]